VIGKRIVRVEQEYVASEYARPAAWVVTAIVLEDGTRMRPIAVEFENDIGVEFRVSKGGE
jgi:predicted peptidase